MSRKTISWALGIFLPIAILCWIALTPRDLPHESSEPVEIQRSLVSSEAIPPSPGNTPSTKDASAPEPSEEDQHRAIDKAHMSAIYGGIQKFFTKYGRYPDYLSELVPEFVSLDILQSPRASSDGFNHLLATDHPDPGLENSGYAYEFSNFIAYGERSFQEIKSVQRSEWGDVVPLLRAFGYDKVINMTWRGDFYETRLNWEYDPATFDLIEQYGWGTGLEGPSTTIVVTDERGNPLANAEVLPAGRNYHFALPERPYITDANGIATIPLGQEINRLTLRVQHPDHAMEPVIFANEEIPEVIGLHAQQAQQINDQLLGTDGLPLANTQVSILIQNASGEAAILAYTRTDEHGRWTANVPPAAVNNATAIPRFPAPIAFSSPEETTAKSPWNQIKDTLPW